MSVNEKRVRIIKEGAINQRPVIYWMHRDQRVQDNWALLFAQQMAIRQKAPLAVLFCLSPTFLDATIRQYGFMLGGLEQVERSLRRYNVPFFLLTGSPKEQIARFLRRVRAGALITDFSPLRISQRWKEEVAKETAIPVFEVDSHNIVPCWITSNKLEFAAHTIRPKINRLLPEYLESFPSMRKHPVRWPSALRPTDWKRARKTLQVDNSVPEIGWLRPGEEAARKVLDQFIIHRLRTYRQSRNDPSKRTLSDLSPYLHFGQLSAQRVALHVEMHGKHLASQEAFLEELIIRRELSDNFCYYNTRYDSFKGFAKWAQETLDQHRRDKRPYLYSLEQLEFGKTHDPLWNAAEMEMVLRGKMHGYMRMYWAKKILEWTKSPEIALRYAIYLNDRYELDGRDPNGYAGIAWSIGGTHDRPWFERPIFGKIRYMSFEGCRRKFDVRQYIRSHVIEPTKG